MTYAASITPDELSALPRAEFYGRILVVESPETMAEAEALLAGEAYVGFDTETRPSFTKGLQYSMALLQLSTADTALLFRLQDQPLSDKIKGILSDPAVAKIGAAIKDDINGLQRSEGKFRAEGFVDLQQIVCQWGINDKSVRKMAGIVLGVKVSKAQKLTNWEARILTESQQSYAAIDAWVCREIYLKLKGII